MICVNSVNCQTIWVISDYNHLKRKLTLPKFLCILKPSLLRPPLPFRIVFKLTTKLSYFFLLFIFQLVAFIFSFLWLIDIGLEWNWAASNRLGLVYQRWNATACLLKFSASTNINSGIKCTCKGSCDSNRCTCRKNNLPCSKAFKNCNDDSCLNSTAAPVDDDNDLEDSEEDM